MLPPQCPFCAHTNPSGAKFCNECGAPLHLRPCNQCDAINDQVAKNCYKCGAAFAMPYTAPEAAPVLPAVDTVAASASLDDLCIESGYASLTESVTESQDVRLREPDDETAAAHDRAVEIVPRAPRSPGADMTSPVSTEDRTANAIPLHDFGTATGPRPLSRLPLAVVLSAAVLTAVGVAAYYAYRHQTQPDGLLSAPPPNPAVPTDVTVPPANPSVARATGPESDDGQMPMPSEGDTPTTPQRVTISDQAAPSQQPATEAGEVAKAPSAMASAQQPATQVAEVAKARSATTAVAADPHHKILRTGARRRTATQSTMANPSASTNQDTAAAALPVQKKAKAKRKPVPRA